MWEHLWEHQLRHKIPHAVPHDLLTYLWSSGNLCLLDDRCQALSHQTNAVRFVILRGKVVCLKPHCQLEKPGATLDLAPTFWPVYHEWPHQQLTPRTKSSSHEQSANFSEPIFRCSLGQLRQWFLVQNTVATYDKRKRWCSESGLGSESSYSERCHGLPSPYISILGNFLKTGLWHVIQDTIHNYPFSLR
jgi:hypothetical protein